MAAAAPAAARLAAWAAAGVPCSGAPLRPSGALGAVPYVGLRYIDRMEYRKGVWKIASRIVAIEDVKASQQVDRLQPIWALAKRDRSDALWQMLSGSTNAKG